MRRPLLRLGPYKLVDGVARVLDRVERFPNADALLCRSVHRSAVLVSDASLYCLAYDGFFGELIMIGPSAEARRPARLVQRTDEE